MVPEAVPYTVVAGTAASPARMRTCQRHLTLDRCDHGHGRVTWPRGHLVAYARRRDASPRHGPASGPVVDRVLPAPHRSLEQVTD